MAQPTPAAVALRAALEPAWTPATLAERLGVSRQSIYQWLDGTTRPSPPIRAALEALLHVPSEGWLDEDERAMLARVTSTAPAKTEAA